MTPMKNNLVALGSAAVVAVYAAGYVRTREAADRFAVEDSQRRQEHERQVATHQTRDTGQATPDTSVQAAAAAPVAMTAHEEATPKRSEVSKPKPTHRTETATAKPHVDSVLAPVADTTAKVIESPPPVSVPAPVTAPPAPSMTFKVTPPASADTTADADKPLKDGVYSGYGRSRHGDIEATVSIKNGKIAEAFISQCLTQYSCSWIAALPPQVVARQSAEVDYVSGATQSTNAFYYAVVAALKKAK